MKMKRLAQGLLSITLGLVLLGPALAQQVTTTIPARVTSTLGSGTIAVTNTFQRIWPAQANRMNCLVQNNDSSADMWVYFGPIANASKAGSVVLPAGASLNCATSGVVSTSEVSITGTATDAFTALLDGAPVVSGSGGGGGGGGGGGNVNLIEIDGTTVSATTPGVLDVNVLSGGGSNASVGTTGAAVPSSGTLVGFEDASGNLTPGTLMTDGSLQATPITIRANGADDLSNSGILGRLQDTTGSFALMGTVPYVFDGTTWDRAPGNSTDGALVNLGSNNDVTVTGNVANDAADSGNPIKVGGVYRATPASVADGDRTDAITDTYGNLRVLVAGQQVSGADAIANSAILSLQANSSASTGTLRPALVAGTVFNGTSWDRARGNTNGLNVQGAGADGVALAGNPVLAAGSDGTNAQTIQTDASGNQYVVLKDGSGTVVPYNPNGQAVAASSGPVVLASEQLGLDGTALSPGSGTAVNDVLFSTDVSGFKWVSAQFTSVGSGNIIRFQASDDNTNWVTLASILNVDNSGTYASTIVPSTGSIASAPVAGKYMRAIISTYGSGTVTALPVLHSSNYAVPYSQLSAPNLWARGVNPGATSSGANARAYSDLIGRQIVLPLAIPESTWSYAAAGITNSTAGVTIKAAAASTIRNYVDSCQIGTSTLATASTLVIRDGAAGTVLFRMPLEAAAGMWTTTQKFEPPLRGSAATLVEIAMETLSATGTLYVNCQGHIAP